jgi:primary-amine oxidase
LSIVEIHAAAKLIREMAAPKTPKFNCITLREPPKLQYAAYRQGRGSRPDRRAFAIIIMQDDSGQVAEVIVNLTQGKIEEWKLVKDVMPTLTLEDLDLMERISRKDPRVIEACRGLGITDMSKVFIDGWAIGVDERWGLERRLQQGLAYYRNHELDNQYAHPLDFTVVADTEREEVLSVDIRYVNGERTAIPLAEHHYLSHFISDGYRHDKLKPIEIVQPQGVSF